MSSCHHPKWKGGIPKGQLLRVCRNCNTIEDFHVQADIMIINRFQEKGYARDNLLITKDEITYMNRGVLLAKTKRNKDRMDLASVTGFYSQYRDFEQILKAYY